LIFGLNLFFFSFSPGKRKEATCPPDTSVVGGKKNLPLRKEKGSSLVIGDLIVDPTWLAALPPLRLTQGAHQCLRCEPFSFRMRCPFKIEGLKDFTMLEGLRLKVVGWRH